MYCGVTESVLGAQYGSALERQLEARLGGARALRDTVAAAAGAWQAGARRAQRAHHAAAQALLAWQLVPHARYTHLPACSHPSDTCTRVLSTELSKMVTLQQILH